MFIVMSSNILQIRQLISEAKHNDPQGEHLAAFTRSKLPVLHHTIKLPCEKPGAALAEFITQYVKHAPDFLEALTQLLQEAGIYEQGQAFLTIAEEFFTAPPKEISDKVGIAALLDKAYLSHRLIEEVSDRIHASCGMPLLPMDMSLSNIVVHALLGDQFANELDLAVHYATEALFSRDGLLNSQAYAKHLAQHHTNCWSHALDRWPCLAGDSSISLEVEGWLGL